MLNVEKHKALQLNLFESEEWVERSRSEPDGSVPSISSDLVSSELLSDCEEERFLTVRLMEKIADLSNLEKACRKVKSNRGSGGIDGMSVKELPQWLSANWQHLQQSLLNGYYQPSPVKCVEIPKANGGVRTLGIPTVIDRLVQQAIHQVLSPRYETIFSDSSFGFRPKRGAHDALEQCSEYVELGAKWLVDIDLEKFFDEVNHSRTIWLLSRRVGDKRVLKLIQKFLKSGMLVDGMISQRIKGTPQGGPLSPLISNIVLDELDKELERRDHKFVRYADDLRVFVESKRSAERVMASLTEFIETKLKLKVNRKKSRVCLGRETNFLGYTLLHNGDLGLSNESYQRVKRALKKTTTRRRGISLEQLVKELNQKLRGWLNYFRYASMKSKVASLIGWLQRRIRSFRLKQCKRASGIFRFFKTLGVPKRKMWQIAVSRKGWWRLSSTPQANAGMNNKWFRTIELFDLMEFYNRYKLEETAVYESTHGGVRGR